MPYKASGLLVLIKKAGKWNDIFLIHVFMRICTRIGICDENSSLLRSTLA